MNKMPPENLKEYLGNQVCLCGSSNFKCFEFENITIILKCNDCGRFEFINSSKYQGIINYSNLEGTYFCKWNSDYPKFIYKNKDIIQINGCNYFNRKKLAKKSIYQMPKKFVISQYKFMINKETKKINKFKKQLVKFSGGNVTK